jgi:glutathione S-transferase
MPSSAKPLLYSFRRCPYAIRARLALQVTETGCELREVLLKDKPPCMLAASPKGTVPVLIQPEGEVLEESLSPISQGAPASRASKSCRKTEAAAR